MKSHRCFSIEKMFNPDRRIVDGREVVIFLVRVKECLEDPARLVLEL